MIFVIEHLQLAARHIPGNQRQNRLPGPDALVEFPCQNALFLPGVPGQHQKNVAFALKLGCLTAADKAMVHQNGFHTVFLRLRLQHLKMRAGIVKADLVQIHFAGGCQLRDHPKQGLCQRPVGIQHTGINNPQDAVLFCEILRNTIPIIAIVQGHHLFPGSRGNFPGNTVGNGNTSVAGADEILLNGFPDRIVQKIRIAPPGNGVPDVQNPLAAELPGRIPPGIDVFQMGIGGKHHIKVFPFQSVDAGLLFGKPGLCPGNFCQHQGAFQALNAVLGDLADTIGQAVHSAFFRGKLGLHLLPPLIPVCGSILPQP